MLNVTSEDTIEAIEPHQSLHLIEHDHNAVAMPLSELRWQLQQCVDDSYWISYGCASGEAYSADRCGDRDPS
jgi:hypothetical protein